MGYQATFVIINVIGGCAVLGSYAHGFAADPQLVPQLWGGVPEAVRPYYTANMFLAAAGYLIAFAYILRRLSPAERAVGGTPLYERLNWLYAAALFCAALWMPLSLAMLKAPDAALWWCVRAVLLVTGGAAVAILALVVQLRQHGAAGAFFWLSVAGLGAFVLQTAVLDALIWPALFPH